ncbi:MAG: rhomboid family intramembrane serine protease [Candidatus Nanoarchaeia archaeon]
MKDKDIRAYTKKMLRPNFFQKIAFIPRAFSLTSWFIILNVFFFIVYLIFSKIYGYESILPNIALQPNAFFSGKYLWTIIVSMFMHGSVSHLLVNMVSLFFIGSFIERLIGRKRFFWLYMLSGIFAGLVFVFLAYFFGTTPFGAKLFGSGDIFAVGASGAIFALGGLLALLTPNLRVYVMFVIPMKMRTAMIFLLGIFWFLSIVGDLPIGNSAHLGGLIAGVGYGIYIRKKYKRKTEMIRKYFS